MKFNRFTLSVAVLLLEVGSVCKAQYLTPITTFIEDFKPASTNQLGQEYPQVNSQGCIRFKIFAPQAKSVAAIVVHGNAEFQSLLFLNKTEDGYWMNTTSSHYEEGGLLSYVLNIDNCIFNDPGSQIFYCNGRWESGIEVPARDEDFYALKDVPHGFVHQILYPKFVSPIMQPITNETPERALVYTPPGYQTGLTRYPVLYLQHSPGENETCLSNQGRINLIMDNLIAARKIKPFIVVMTNGTVDPNDIPRASRNRLGLLVADDFKTNVADYLVPYIDANFRTLPNPANRAIAGTSKGLRSQDNNREDNLSGLNILNESYSSGPIRPDVFSYHALLDRDFYLPEEIKDKAAIKLIFMCDGNNQATSDFKQATDALKNAGINVVIYTPEKPIGNVQTYRRNIYQLAQVLFK